MDLPIACTLSAPELARRREALKLVWDRALDVSPIAGGYATRFPAHSETFHLLCEVVDLERQCCPFLTFKIVIEPQQPLTLEVTGPPEALKAIEEFFAG